MKGFPGFKIEWQGHGWTFKGAVLSEPARLIYGDRDMNRIAIEEGKVVAVQNGFGEPNIGDLYSVDPPAVQITYDGYLSGIWGKEPRQRAWPLPQLPAIDLAQLDADVRVALLDAAVVWQARNEESAREREAQIRQARETHQAIQALPVRQAR